MYKSPLYKILVFFLVVSFNSLFGQHSQDKELLKFTEKFYGTDDRMQNGTLLPYQQKNDIGHAFFEMYDWYNGEIYINGGAFKNILLKYHILSDEIYYRGQNEQGVSAMLKLNKDLIDSVRLHNHLFINAERVLNLEEPLGFVENVYNGDFSVFLKYEIAFSEERSATGITRIFKKPKYKIYILFEGKLFYISSKKELSSFFGQNKNQVIQFLKRNRIKLNKSNSIQLNTLFKYCDEISSK